MQLRTAFSALALTALMFSGSLFAQAAAEPFQEGVHYQLIQPAQPTANADKVEVVEVFGYTCPHCANFQPHMDSWLERQGDDVDFSRIPVVFSPAWEPFARAYYTALALNVLDQSHGALFDALHKQRKPLRSPEDLATFFTEFGVSEEDFLKTTKSFAVNTRVTRGTTTAQRYGVTGTPSMVINGRYLTTGRMAGSMQKVIQVTDYLIAKESAAMAN